jgi:hypothetical protein
MAGGLVRTLLLLLVVVMEAWRVQQALQQLTALPQRLSVLVPRQQQQQPRLLPLLLQGVVSGGVLILLCCGWLMKT